MNMFGCYCPITEVLLIHSLICTLNQANNFLLSSFLYVQKNVTLGIHAIPRPRHHYVISSVYIERSNTKHLILIL